MADNLNHAGHGVGAVEGAFGSVNDFDFVDVIEGQVRKIESATRFVDRSAIDEHFSEIGIAAIDEDGGKAAYGSCTREADSGLSSEEIRERDGLPLLDFLAAYEINRGRCAVDFDRLSVGTDDDALRKPFNFETDAKRAVLVGGQFQNKVARDKGNALEMNAVAARRENKKILSTLAGGCRPIAGTCRTVKLRGDFHLPHAIPGSVCKFSGKA